MKNKNLVDIIFENRNKSYGAYELRTTENNTLLKALCFGILIIALAMGGVVLSNQNKTSHATITDEIGCKLIIVDLKPLELDPVKPPLEEDIKTSEVKRLQEDTKQVKEIMPEPTKTPQQQETIIDRDKTIDADLGAENRTGTQLSTTQVGGGDVSTGDKNVSGSQNNANISQGENKTTPVTNRKAITARNAKVMAIFPGCEKEVINGNEALVKCLNDKLSRELADNLNVNALEDQADAVVKMQFIIDKNGEITQIKSATATNQNLGNEAKKALEKINKNIKRKGKKIKPAQYEDGSEADLIFSIPVRFQQL